MKIGFIGMHGYSGHCISLYSPRSNWGVSACGLWAGPVRILSGAKLPSCTKCKKLGLPASRETIEMPDASVEQVQAEMVRRRLLSPFRAARVLDGGPQGA